MKKPYLGLLTAVAITGALAITVATSAAPTTTAAIAKTVTASVTTANMAVSAVNVITTENNVGIVDNVVQAAPAVTATGLLVCGFALLLMPTALRRKRHAGNMHTGHLDSYSANTGMGHLIDTGPTVNAMTMITNAGIQAPDIDQHFRLATDDVELVWTNDDTAAVHALFEKELAGAGTD